MRVAGRDFDAPLPVRYLPPSACGLDRVFAVVGALARLPEASGVLVLDLGTCLTATVGRRGEGILGGAILPGFDLMARSLGEWTSALPLVPWGERGAALGRSTEESIRSGIWAALVGGARELIRSIQVEYEAPLLPIAIGSGAGALASELPEIKVVHPFAVLWGVQVSAFPSELANAPALP